MTLIQCYYKNSTYNETAEKRKSHLSLEADVLLLVKCYDKKWLKPPFSYVILLLTQP